MVVSCNWNDDIGPLTAQPDANTITAAAAAHNAFIISPIKVSQGFIVLCRWIGVRACAIAVV
jgi:hypothetical protein